MAVVAVARRLVVSCEKAAATAIAVAVLHRRLLYKGPSLLNRSRHGVPQAKVRPPRLPPQILTKSMQNSRKGSKRIKQHTWLRSRKRLKTKHATMTGSPTATTRPSGWRSETPPCSAKLALPNELLKRCAMLRGKEKKKRRQLRLGKTAHLVELPQVLRQA